MPSALILRLKWVWCPPLGLSPKCRMTSAKLEQLRTASSRTSRVYFTLLPTEPPIEYLFDSPERLSRGSDTFSILRCTIRDARQQVTI